MNTKNTFLSVIACLAAIFSQAQENVAVTYTVTNCDNDSGTPYSYDMNLISDSEKSLYYNAMSLYVDSCNSTPEGKAKLREIQLKAWRVVHPDGSVTYDGRKLGLAPEKKEYLYVEKDIAKGKQTVFDYFAEGLSSYTEPLDEMEWKILDDSTNTVLGYECIMAETNYHGRKWKVWFTPEIPLPEGPWKLHGLPGLILKAEGGDGFFIVAKEVGVTKQPVPGVYSVDQYERGERRKLLAEKEYYYNNLESMLAAQSIRLNGDGSSANLPKYNRQKRVWETDY